MCPEEVFEGKTFRLKSFFSISLWNWVDDFQDSGGKCRKYHQSCILPVRANILPKKGLGEKEFNTCGFSGKKSQNFGGRVSRRNCSYETNFAKKGNSNHLLNLAEKVSNFSPKVHIRAVITEFCVSKRWILGGKIWKYTVLCFSRTLRNTFWTLCEKFFAGLSFMHFTRPKGVFGRNFSLKSALYLNGFQAIRSGFYCT